MRSFIPLLALTTFAYASPAPLAARAFPPGLEKQGGWQVDIFRTVTGEGYKETVNAKFFSKRFPNGVMSTCSKSRPNPNDPRTWTEACDPSDKFGDNFFYTLRPNGDFEILQKWKRQPTDENTGAEGQARVTLRPDGGKDRLKASLNIPVSRFH